MAFVATPPARAVVQVHSAKHKCDLWTSNYRPVVLAPLTMKGSGNGAPKSNKGLFGKLKDDLLRRIVTVPGGGGDPDKELIECVFCEGVGKIECDGCNGTGIDVLGSTCLMCDGKKVLTCPVCNGVGMVDRVRRGGTDDEKQFVVKGKEKERTK